MLLGWLGPALTYGCAGAAVGLLSIWGYVGASWRSRHSGTSVLRWALAELGSKEMEHLKANE